MITRDASLIGGFTMRFSTHGRALWRGAAVLGIMALGLTWWAAGESNTMPGKSKQPESLSVVAGRIEDRIRQSGKPGLEKVRLAVVLHAEKMQTADALFKALKDGGQEDEYAVLGHAKAQFSSGRSADTIQHLQELSVRYPNSPTILYELGMAHIGLKRSAEGIVLMKRVLEIDPFHVRANYELAKWSAARSEPDKAIEYARRVLSAEDPGSPLAEKALLMLDKLIPKKEP
jgi:tetratricopeptide (TPR) repeat protein